MERGSGGIKTARLGNPGSCNRYAYVSGDPVNKLDPTGTEDVDDFDWGWDGDDPGGGGGGGGGDDGGGGGTGQVGVLQPDGTYSFTTTFDYATPPQTALVPTPIPTITQVIGDILGTFSNVITAGVIILLNSTPTSGTDTLSPVHSIGAVSMSRHTAPRWVRQSASRQPREATEGARVSNRSIFARTGTHTRSTP